MHTAGLVPPGFDGGKAVTCNMNGYRGFTAIPARVGRDPERVRGLLRVLDYLAAPFGSEERTFLNFGLEGEHPTVGPNGAPLANDRFRGEQGGLVYLLSSEYQYHYPEARTTR